jgi:predicted extracellular nuclease
LLNNDLQTQNAALTGSGSQLTLILTANTDSGSEAIAFQNIVIDANESDQFGACGDPATFIHDIQGSGASSPEQGNIHVIEGVVVGDFQDVSTGLKGFFVQEEDIDVDADPTTSEGIFVFDNGFGVDVMIGDLVRVMGTVTEFSGLTELTNISNVAVCPPGDSASAAIVDLPVSSLDVWEQYEGMSVNFLQTLYATDNYSVGRYGEVGLSFESRLYAPTNVVAPGAPAIARQDLNDRSLIQMDDGSTIQNPDPVPYLGLGNTLRAGDSILGLSGVLSYSFESYEVHPTEAVDFVRNNSRDIEPLDVGGIIKVASFNVLNYFTTLDDGSLSCGPTSDLGCRGADSAEEFTRQKAKIISAMVTMDADVIGLMEIENHLLDEAVIDLVNGLNSIAGPGTYNYIDTGPIGADAIKVAFIYKPGEVTPVGAYAILDSSDDPTFIDTKNRPALAQTFQQNANGGKFTAVVNHVKSKGSPCDDVGDPDMGDGQGNCNLTRTSAATALVNWLTTDPTGSGDINYLIIGDLNAYAMEDPIAAIKGAGYTDLIEQFVTRPYSYVFYGQAGYLDHALVSSNLTSQVTGVTVWHINADEPSALDYNDYNQSYLYNPDQYRSSDHDPVIIGLSVCDEIAPTLEVSVTPDKLWPPNHKYVTVEATVVATDNFDPNPTVTLVSVTSNEPDNGVGDGNTTNDIVIVDDFTFKLRAERSGKGTGRVYTITYMASDDCGNSATDQATVTVPHDKGKNKKQKKK